jgi:hypothetical protein
LKYYFLDEDGEKGEDKKIYFNIPSITGYEGGTYRLVKVDENGKGLGGATFTLTHTSHDETCTNGHIHSCDEEWTYSVQSDKDGYVNFQNIPSGHDYILKETSAPDGYQSTSETHILKVDFSKVTIDGEENKQITVVNKEIEYVDLSGSKTWIGDEKTDSRPSSITVNLYGTYEEDGKPYYVTGLDTVTETKTAYKTATTNSRNNWSWSWDGETDKIYETCLGHKIEWFVEDEVTNYISVSNGMDLINIYSTPQTDTFDYIGKYSNKVLIVQGDKDNIVRLSVAEKAAEHYDKARLVVLSGEGHGFSPEGSKRAMEEVLQFMQG